MAMFLGRDGAVHYRAAPGVHSVDVEIRSAARSAPPHIKAAIDAGRRRRGLDPLWGRSVSPLPASRTYWRAKILAIRAWLDRQNGRISSP